MSDLSERSGPLPRLATGIDGLDALTGGGLPEGETTLLCGTTGTGKTVLAQQFLAAGNNKFGHPAVFVTFEQDPEKLRRVAATFGWDVGAWEASGVWAFVDASRSTEREVVIGEEFDLAPLIARIAAAVQETAAKRVVLDTLTAVHARLGDATRVRAELHRVIVALEELGVTAIITAEREDDYGPVARYGVEEFVSDNIIILRFVLSGERRRRTLEVLKFRGMHHALGEFPFAIMEGRGLVMIILSEIPLTYPSSNARVSMGNPQLNEMCGGGALQASVILISGATGTGKSLLALEFLTAGDSQDRALLIAFEESAEQIARNAHGWGLDLDAMRASGRLLMHCQYPASATVERHLVAITDAIDEHKPTRLVVDGLSAIKRISDDRVFHEFVMAITALVKERQIASVFTSAPELLGVSSTSDIEASTLLDTIILLRFIEIYGEMHRGIAILKMRGSDHDKTIRSLEIGSTGSRIGAPYRTTTGIISGTALQLIGPEGARIEELFKARDRQTSPPDHP